MLGEILTDYAKTGWANLPGKKRSIGVKLYTYMWVNGLLTPVDLPPLRMYFKLTLRSCTVRSRVGWRAVEDFKASSIMWLQWRVQGHMLKSLLMYQAQGQGKERGHGWVYGDTETISPAQHFSCAPAAYSCKLIHFFISFSY